MPLIVSQDVNMLAMDRNAAIADLTPEDQCRVICAALAKPVKAATIRRALLSYWWTVEKWETERPDLFDRVLYQFVAEIEERNASAPDGMPVESASKSKG